MTMNNCVLCVHDLTIFRANSNQTTIIIIYLSDRWFVGFKYFVHFSWAKLLDRLSHTPHCFHLLLFEAHSLFFFFVGITKLQLKLAWRARRDDCVRISIAWEPISLDLRRTWNVNKSFEFHNIRGRKKINLTIANHGSKFIHDWLLNEHIVKSCILDSI